MPLCTAATDIFCGSHAKLDALFEAAGVPGPPPQLSHPTKWKTWLFGAGNDPDFDSLAVLGNLIGEFMDLSPETEADLDLSNSLFNLSGTDPIADYRRRRARIVRALEDQELRYYRGGRVLPNGEQPKAGRSAPGSCETGGPSNVETLLETLIRGLPRAMHPLTHRRKGATALSFDVEYDIQDLLHSQLRPWIADIRPEEFTPSYAGSSARMDFLFPAYRLVIETKRVRDRNHATKVGDELIVDIEHYRRHECCDRLWCVIYDPLQLIPNPSGLVNDIEGQRSTPEGAVDVRLFVISA